MVSTHSSGVYKIHSIKTEFQNEEARKEKEGESDDITAISENKYAAKERSELRDAEKEAAEKEAGSMLDDNGSTDLLVTRSIIIGALTIVIMIVSSTFFVIDN